MHWRVEQKHACGVLVAALVVLAGCGDDTRSPGSQAKLPAEWVVVGNQRVSVEIAASPEERSRGLMFRESLPENHGMLFLFPQEQVLSFWMRNTVIPLSIAYADSGGTIVRIADLEPGDERPVVSGRPARYALEMNRGWFIRHGVLVGDRIAGIPRVPVN